MSASINPPRPAAQAAVQKPAVLRPAVHKHFHRLAWLAVALALGVIVFGAFVRLSNAGLSCPDWPTCYGRADVAEGRARGRATTPPARSGRSKRTRPGASRCHRMIAGALGVLVLVAGAAGRAQARAGRRARDRRGRCWWRSRSRCTCKAQHVAASALALRRRSGAAVRRAALEQLRPRARRPRSRWR